jgi:hypothetical protein
MCLIELFYFNDIYGTEVAAKKTTRRSRKGTGKSADEATEECKEATKDTAAKKTTKKPAAKKTTKKKSEEEE